MQLVLQPAAADPGAAQVWARSSRSGSPGMGALARHLHEAATASRRRRAVTACGPTASVEPWDLLVNQRG
jgi:hypothetical protein